jgi:hypothetical protein
VKLHSPPYLVAVGKDISGGGQEDDEVIMIAGPVTKELGDRPQDRQVKPCRL